MARPTVTNILPEALAVLGLGASRSAGGQTTLTVHKGGPGGRALACHSLAASGANVALFALEGRELVRLADLLRLLSGARPGRQERGTDAPVWERPWIALPPFPPGSAGLGAWARRMAALYALSRGPTPGKPVALVAGLPSLLPKLPPRDLFDNHHLDIRVGEELSPELIVEQAVSWGYERVGLVTRPGELARRGDILDVFAPGYEEPVRLEFFGDTVEDARLFNPVSQRARASLAELTLLPAGPMVLTDRYKEEAREHWERLAQAGALPTGARARLEESLVSPRAPLMPGLYYQKPSRLTDWLPPGVLVCLPGKNAATKSLEDAAWGWEEAPAQSLGLPASRLRAGAVEGLELYEREPRLVFEDITMGGARAELELPEREVEAFDQLLPGREARERPWHALVEGLKRWSVEERQVVLSFHTERGRAKFLHLAQQEGLSIGLDYQPGGRGLMAAVSPFKGGVILPWAGARILSEDVIQPARAARPPVSAKDFAGLKDHKGLGEGDLLVHRDYGLGRFEGLKHMDLGGVAGDYLLLVFAGGDKVYLPVDRMNLVQPYQDVGAGAPPALDRLGGAGWVKSRAKARKAVEKIAHDLMEMYAYRRLAKGYAYGEVGELYREFEASFGFEETPDQARAIAEVLADMEKPQPMDRLVCGDVGFGKTEVALRAAFRAVHDGRQVALLCPTTVLAEQHYQTFSRRFEGYPVTIGLLSRFVPAARQKKVLAAAAKGQVDILIGTHRILSKDVSLPNLGLMVLDEEQRFGVRHKERLKSLKQNIDVLTLTATPIPRTLQLSLSGIRELSVIETPPPERKAVACALLEHDEAVLRQVLEREMARGGQVFWVHNRVRGLAEVMRAVQELAPKARVGMAHGQMSEKALEESMRGFWHGELDVLVCTSIVESGLDFPRANTLVVDGAHMFGLGQLYQLRGRVGRSDQQAYAYFLVKDLSALADDARERLKVIMEADYLGAGFQVAMEDLKLRGAGNILGEAQTGTIAKVGLELFLEMLEEEVGKLKGEPPRERADPELAIGFEAHIPEAYVAEPKDRLYYYKGLASAATPEAAGDIEMEMRDRFGPFPKVLDDFLGVLSLKRLAKEMGVVKVELGPERLRLLWPENGAQTPESLKPLVEPERLVAFVTGQMHGRAKLLPPAGLELRLEEKGTMRERLAEAGAALATLLS